MTINFTIAKKNTSDLEGGFWNDPSAGFTYAGITAKYFPNWRGWPILQRLAAARGWRSLASVPRYTKFNDRELDKAIAEFYHQNFWLKVMQGDKFRNQQIQSLIYDFLVHKMYDAVAVVNHTARTINKNVAIKKTVITDEVINLANTFQKRFYDLLIENRKLYYRNPKRFAGTNEDKFSSKMITAFVNRVNKFPSTIADPLRLINFPLNPFRLWR